MKKGENFVLVECKNHCNIIILCVAHITVFSKQYENIHGDFCYCDFRTQTLEFQYIFDASTRENLVILLLKLHFFGEWSE